MKSCVTRLLRKLSTRYKHQKLIMVCPVLEIREERAQPNLISRPQKRNVIVPVKCATKNTQFGNVLCSRVWNIERNGRRQRNLDCVTVVWGKGTLVIFKNSLFKSVKISRVSCVFSYTVVQFCATVGESLSASGQPIPYI